MTLAVTGGIGSGKSAACSVFRRLGIPVYDSDSRTKCLYTSLPGLAERISQAMGICLTVPGGGVDRARLAEAVFRDAGKLALLEDIVHPEVKLDFLRWKESSAGPFVVLESAIILGKPLFADIVDRLLLVDAPVEVRMRRAMARDGAGKEEVLRRMARQKLLNDISEGKSACNADFIIVNDGDFADLERKVTEVYMNLVKQKLSDTNNED